MNDREWFVAQCCKQNSADGKTFSDGRNTASSDVRHDAIDGRWSADRVIEELVRRTSLNVSSRIDATTCHRLNAYPVLVATASRDASMHITHQRVAKFRNPHFHVLSKSFISSCPCQVSSPWPYPGAPSGGSFSPCLFTNIVSIRIPSVCQIYSRCFRLALSIFVACPYRMSLYRGSKFFIASAES